MNLKNIQVNYTILKISNLQRINIYINFNNISQRFHLSIFSIWSTTNKLFFKDFI